MLREKRTKREAKLIHAAKLSGVRAPVIFDVSLKETTIEMSFIEGYRLREVLNSQEGVGIVEKVGRDVAKLHSNGIIHGDLTTSNIIVNNGEVYFVDFGLGFFSNLIEDFAVDINVFLKSVESAHNSVFDIVYDRFYRGYKHKKRKEIFEKVREIRKRARYVER
mgnify:CR=1 FL=1